MARLSLASHIASKLAAIENCKKQNNLMWEAKHIAELLNLVNQLPSGSGIDSGIILSEDSTPEKLIFEFSYHHMNDVGYYTNWTHHRVIVKASLLYELDIRITGKNQNDIKDYLYDLFFHSLTSPPSSPASILAEKT